VTERHDAVANYDARYTAEEVALERLISLGGGLSQVLTTFERQSSPGRDETADKFGYVLGNETYKLPSLDAATLLWLGRLITREFLLRHIPSDCDQIIEIGAGYGPILFHLWLGGAPRTAEYCCLEPSQVARHMARRLASLAPIRFTDDTVDLADLNIRSAIRGRKVFVYTCGAAVAVQRLPEDIFDRLTDDPRIVGGAHIEPGAWQIGDATPANLAARDYLLAYGRNENFFLLLKRAEREGILRIDEFTENAWYHALAPFSLVAWSRRY